MQHSNVAMIQNPIYRAFKSQNDSKVLSAAFEHDNDAKPYSQSYIRADFIHSRTIASMF